MNEYHLALLEIASCFNETGNLIMVSFIDSLTAPLSLVNALIVSSARGRRNATKQNLAELEKIWAEYNIYEKSEEAHSDE